MKTPTLRWTRTHSNMYKGAKFPIFITVAFCACSGYMLLYNTNYFHYDSMRFHRNISDIFRRRSHVLFTEGCKVPNFDPFDPEVAEYFKRVGENIICKGEKYLSIKNNRVIFSNAHVPENFKCTYKPIYRNPKNETSRADDKVGFGKKATLAINESLPEEFVKVNCVFGKNGRYTEYFASTPIKPSVEDRCVRDSSKVLRKDTLNVIIVGIDSVSKLNFERHFRRTAHYLRQNLSAFEFHGYMKVAENTFPNLTPLLTGHFVKHYYTESNRWRFFDDLDFIWKNFSSIGYRTLYAEDAPSMATFNLLRSGFLYPPTDYYIRPFTLAIEDTPWQKASNVDCLQANPEIVVLFNYLRSFLQTMGDRLYFAFTWAVQLTHDHLNKAGYADKPTYELLKDIHDMGLLNRSVLVLLSDHGMRLGDIRKTFIGKIEDRMPFLFMSFPDWFLEANPNIRANLFANQRRLVTPFDVHKTLVDLYQIMSGDKNYARTPYGISLFNEIPMHRNCHSAYILPHWCVCHEYEQLSLKDNMTLNGAKAVVRAINDLTKPFRDLCEELELNSILDAIVTKPEEDFLKYKIKKELEWGGDESTIRFGRRSNTFQNLVITIRTDPGEAEFESTIRKVKNNYKTYDISRINVYGNQSHCINDANLRKYCYCKDLR